MIPEIKHMPEPNRLILFSIKSERFRLNTIQVFRIINANSNNKKALGKAVKHDSSDIVSRSHDGRKKG